VDVCNVMMGRGTSGDRDGDCEDQRSSRLEAVVPGVVELDVRTRRFPEDLKSRNAW